MDDSTQGSLSKHIAASIKHWIPSTSILGSYIHRAHNPFTIHQYNLSPQSTFPVLDFSLQPQSSKWSHKRISKSWKHKHAVTNSRLNPQRTTEIPHISQTKYGWPSQINFPSFPQPFHLQSWHHHHQLHPLVTDIAPTLQLLSLSSKLRSHSMLSWHMPSARSHFTFSFYRFTGFLTT